MHKTNYQMTNQSAKSNQTNQPAQPCKQNLIKPNQFNSNKQQTVKNKQNQIKTQTSKIYKIHKNTSASNTTRNKITQTSHNQSPTKNQSKQLYIKSQNSK